MKRLFFILILLFNLLFLAWSPQTTAQDTTLQRFTLQEYGAYPRSGDWLLYTWPGNPWGFSDFGADFFVNQACFASGQGGIFLSEGRGYGYLGQISFWPFPLGTMVGNIDLCDPEADLAAWFYYGDSLNSIFPRTDGDLSFFGEDQTITDTSCSTQPVSREGVFFVALRSTDRQLPNVGCPGGLTGSTPIQIGNALICSLVSPWVNASGAYNTPVIRSCEWYYTCSDRPVGGVGRGVSCAAGGTTTQGNGVIGVTVINASNKSSISGATVSYPGGPTQTTDSGGNTTFNKVPAGSSITFTASASNFATGSAAVTPVANSTTPLTIPLAPVVACSTSQVAGGDTPDTRFVNLNQTGGTFLFQYSTYSQKDRIIIKHDGGVLLDTGCVGESNSKNLSYSGNATGVTVEVQPNCAGGTGTAWDYSVHCPQ